MATVIPRRLPLASSLRWTALSVALLTAGTTCARATGPDVKFDFARTAEYKDTTTAERAERYPGERLITVRLPVSVRFQGLAQGEIEHLDIEVDGSAAGLRVDCFAPATQLASEATAIETITRSRTDRSLGATLSGAIPVPVGGIVAEVGPSVSAGRNRSDEATEKIERLPPKRPVVVSGTFAEGQGVFFKFKQSSQTSFEGVHELEVTFIAPAHWEGGGVRVACTARGHRPVLWMDHPSVFGRASAIVELYPAGDAKRRDAAARKTARTADAPARRSDCSLTSWVLGE